MEAIPDPPRRFGRVTSMSTSSERAAANESLFRHVNERIEDTAVRWGTTESGIEAVCECDDLDCEGRIHLTVREYEMVRANPGSSSSCPAIRIPSSRWSSTPTSGIWWCARSVRRAAPPNVPRRAASGRRQRPMMSAAPC